jgi:hypothetical protein
MVSETLAALADLRAFDLLLMAAKGVGCLRRVHWATAAEPVGEVGHASLVDVDRRARHAVTLIVVHRGKRSIDRQLGEIGPDTAKLGVDVVEEPPLQRVISKVGREGTFYPIRPTRVVRQSSSRC